LVWTFGWGREEVGPPDTMSLSLLLDPDDDEMKKKKAKSPPSAGTAELGQNGGEELDDSPFQPSRSSSRLSARRCKQAAAEAERRAVAEAASWDFAAPLLWRELRAASEASRKKAAAKGREAKLAKQQRILRHIAWTRFEQDLPPVFAILRGPTIRPYRMEELSISIGRATPHHRDVDLALESRNVKISRVHARITFDQGRGCYCIINLSKNGVQVKQDDLFVTHKEVGVPVPLPNPATINIQGTLIYFQVFFVATSTGFYIHDDDDDGDDEDEEGDEGGTELRKKASKGAANKRKRGQGLTYSEMIQTALRALGGAATQPKISRYIQEHFKEDIAGRTTWRNSVSGVLSANPLFIQEAIISEGGKKDRKSLWRLKGYPIPGIVDESTAQGEKDEEEEEEGEVDGGLVMDEEGEEEEEEADDDISEARHEKRLKGEEEQ